MNWYYRFKFFKILWSEMFYKIINLNSKQYLPFTIEWKYCVLLIIYYSKQHVRNIFRWINFQNIENDTCGVIRLLWITHAMWKLITTQETVLNQCLYIAQHDITSPLKLFPRTIFFSMFVSFSRKVIFLKIEIEQYIGRLCKISFLLNKLGKKIIQ